MVNKAVPMVNGVVPMVNEAASMVNEALPNVNEVQMGAWGPPNAPTQRRAYRDLLATGHSFYYC
jgi:hypothetical protein